MGICLKITENLPESRHLYTVRRFNSIKTSQRMAVLVDGLHYTVQRLYCYNADADGVHGISA